MISYEAWWRAPLGGWYLPVTVLTQPNAKDEVMVRTFALTRPIRATVLTVPVAELIGSDEL